jgi:hypothetical protein
MRFVPSNSLPHCNKTNCVVARACCDIVNWRLPLLADFVAEVGCCCPGGTIPVPPRLDGFRIREANNLWLSEISMESRVMNKLEVSLWGVKINAEGIVAIVAAFLIVLAILALFFLRPT